MIADVAGDVCSLVLSTPSPATSLVDLSAYPLAVDGRVPAPEWTLHRARTELAGDVMTLGTNDAGAILHIRLESLPVWMDTIVVVASSRDGASLAGALSLGVNVSSDCPPVDFAVPVQGTGETAVVIGVFRRAGPIWSFQAIGKLMPGGIDRIAKHYGAELIGSTNAVEDAVEAERKRRLEDLKSRDKDLAASASAAFAVLQRRGQANLRAKVTLVIDISISMLPLFQSGGVDDLVRRIEALGFQLDDDGKILVILFGRKAQIYGDVSEGSYRTFTKSLVMDDVLEPNTMYGEAMELVRNHYAPFDDGLPVYVMFITDGETNDRDKSMRMLVESSSEPIFWQFMAVNTMPPGTSTDPQPQPEGFAFLEELDTLPGRKLDNSDFFRIDTPSELEDEYLYASMFSEFPAWLENAKLLGIVKA